MAVLLTNSPLSSMLRIQDHLDPLALPDRPEPTSEELQVLRLKLHKVLPKWNYTIYQIPEGIFASAISSDQRSELNLKYQLPRLTKRFRTQHLIDGTGVAQVKLGW